MAGILDFLQTPAGTGLLSAVAGGMAGARKGTPWNNMGRAGIAGLTGYTAAQDDILRNKQLEEAQKMQALQRQQIERQVTQQETQAKFFSPENMSKFDKPATPEQTSFANGPIFSQETFGMKPDFTSKTTPATPGGFDMDAYTKAMLGSGDPTIAQKGLEYLGKKEDYSAKRQDKIDELRMRSQDKFDAIELQAQQNRITREEADKRSAELRRDLAGQSNALRRDLNGGGSNATKAPSGYRFTADGNLEQIPGGPADQKTQARLEGGSTVDTVIAGLRDMYGQLDEQGGITNPDKSIFSNVPAGIQSSAAGQAVGKLVGTKNQSSRNTIAQTRPILLQAIMKATGMSAKQMDSNAELKLYLATATDPTLDVAANKRALDSLEKLYGSESGKAPPKQEGSQKTATLADIQETARKSGKSTEEVTRIMKAKGYKIGGN